MANRDSLNDGAALVANPAFVFGPSIVHLNQRLYSSSLEETCRTYHPLVDLLLAGIRLPLCVTL